jgi:hypothetical protein
VLLPDRKYTGFWTRILHDQTASAIERDVSQLPHANVTTVPFHFGRRGEARTGLAVHPGGRPERGKGTGRMPAPPMPDAPSPTASGAPPNGETDEPAPRWRDGITPIADVRWRDRVTIAGRIQTLRSQSSGGSTTLECVIEDDTGAMSIVFTGRRQIGGLEVGTRLRAQGMAAEHRGRLAIFNPAYALVVDPD